MTKKPLLGFVKLPNLIGIPAQYYLGLMYMEGRGVAKNPSVGIGWYKKAAAKGNKKAFSALLELEKNKSGKGQEKGIAPR